MVEFTDITTISHGKSEDSSQFEELNEIDKTVHQNHGMDLKYNQ